MARDLRLRSRKVGLPIGRYPDVLLAEARKRAARERVRIHDGIDVAAERCRSKDALRSAKTSTDPAEDYTERAAVALAVTTRNELLRYLAKDIAPRRGTGVSRM